MSVEQNKTLDRRYFEEVYNRGNLNVVDELIGPQCLIHGPLGDVTGPQGIRQLLGSFLAAFSDVHYSVHEQIGEGDWVATRWTAEGKHTAELMGIPPSGKKFRLEGTTVSHVAQGKLVEVWHNYDNLGFMQQIGAMPAPAVAR